MKVFRKIMLRSNSGSWDIMLPAEQIGGLRRTRMMIDNWMVRKGTHRGTFAMLDPAVSKVRLVARQRILKNPEIMVREIDPRKDALAPSILHSIYTLALTSLFKMVSDFHCY